MGGESAGGEGGMVEDPAPENGRRALFSNYFEVGHNAYEVVIHCGEGYAEGQDVAPHTRIRTSPAYAKALLVTLAETIEQYEREYGPLLAADGSPGTRPRPDPPPGAQIAMDELNPRGTAMAEERSSPAAASGDPGSPDRTDKSRTEALRSEVGRTQKSLQDLRREMESLERHLREGESELAERDAAAREIDTAAGAAATGLALARAEFESVQEFLTAQGPAIEQDVEALQADLDAEIAAVNARVAKRTERRNALEQRMRAQRAELDQARERAASRQQQYDTLKNFQAGLTERLGEIASLRQRIRQAVGTQPVAAYAMVVELRRLVKEFESYGAAASDYRKTLTTAWDSVREAQQKVRQLEEEGARLSSDAQQATNEVVELRTSRLTRMLERAEALASTREAAPR